VSTARADADAQRVRLSWVRGAGASDCVDQPTLEARVVKRLGRAAFAAAAPLSIEASVERDEQGLKAVIFTRTAPSAAPSKREITSTAENCRALEAATTLAIALVIDPDAPLTEAEPEVDTVVRDPPQPPPPPPPQRDDEPEPPGTASAPAGHWTGSLALRGTVATGVLPSTAPGVETALSLGPSEWLVPSVNALLLPEQRTGDGRFAFGLTAFGLGVCVQPSSRRLIWVRACGSLLAGSLHSVVFELLPSRPGQRLWAAAAVTPAVRLAPIAGTFVELGGEVMAPLTRESFTVEGLEEPIFRGQPVAFRGFFGVGLDFP
jgi:hypothetical protein